MIRAVIIGIIWGLPIAIFGFGLAGAGHGWTNAWPLGGLTFFWSYSGHHFMG